MEIGETFLAPTREAWRAWLAEHHATSAQIWLVFGKKDSGVQTVTLDEAMEEAVCFGWVDSIMKRLDDRTNALRFPSRDVFYIFLRDLFVIALAKGSLEHDADRKWKPLEVREMRFFQYVESVKFIFLFQYITCVKEIIHMAHSFDWMKFCKDFLRCHCILSPENQGI